MIKSFKVRIFPNSEQEELIFKHIGCCRFIWNHMLALEIDRYENGEKHLNHFDMNKLLTPLKKQEEFSWLNEVSSQSLKLVCGDLDKAYKAFFGKNNKHKHPKFKSKKKDKKSFPLTQDQNKTYFKDDEYVQIPKLGKVKYQANYKTTLPIGKGVGKFMNPRISLKGKKWILSFGMEIENQDYQLNEYSLGIDLGITDTAIIFYDGMSKKFHNINKSKRMKRLSRRLRHLQRDVSRKYEANKIDGKFVKTKAIIDLEEKISLLYKRITDIRHNYNHHLSSYVVNLLPKRIVMEDLNITGMMKNRHLSRAIAEQCWYEIIRQVKYKSEWKGIEFVQAYRFFPSSKMCSNCGSVNKKLKLKDRTYVCKCGFVEDRDINAAINLSKYVA